MHVSPTAQQAGGNKSWWQALPGEAWGPGAEVGAAQLLPRAPIPPPSCGGLTPSPAAPAAPDAAAAAAATSPQPPRLSALSFHRSRPLSLRPVLSAPLTPPLSPSPSPSSPHPTLPPSLAPSARPSGARRVDTGGLSM